MLIIIKNGEVESTPKWSQNVPKLQKQHKTIGKGLKITHKVHPQSKLYIWVPHMTVGTTLHLKTNIYI